MNILLGYVSPLMIGLVIVVGAIADHGLHTIGDWILLIIMLILISPMVGIVWYFTWTRPVLKSGSWFDRW